MSNASEMLTTTEQFYRRLLDLGALNEIAPLLDDALRLIVAVTGARIAYLEIHADTGDAVYWRGHGCMAETIDAIRARISKGIIAFALAEGRTVNVASAINDARFSDLGSVRQNEIGSVLCAPIDIHGALYLQDRQVPGEFPTIDQQRVEIFARQVALVAGKLLYQTETTPLAEELKQLQARRVREAMERHDGNVSGAARELGVARSFVYSVLRRGPGV
jgi:GAF domain-containing protein